MASSAASPQSSHAVADPFNLDGFVLAACPGTRDNYEAAIRELRAGRLCRSPGYEPISTRARFRSLAFRSAGHGALAQS